ncbi:hypothetical protein [Alkalihalobacterium elongatum]|uniref:hypothetical protein n=1 Tax=Alkalihalobacterium elongatum TaxID=2675466 RepID=UPI001C1FF9E7|nr:hypothetical protein [Alkalihalobacterium elongatum]
MNNRKQNDDELRYILKQKETIKASKEARAKSLQAFQDGLKEGIHSPQKLKRHKRRENIIGISATVAAAGIVSLLILNSSLFEDEAPIRDGSVVIGGGEDSNLPGEKEISIEDVPPNEENNLQYSEKQDFSLESVLDRPSFDYDDLNPLGTFSLYNDTFYVRLPNNWSVEENKGDAVHSIYMSGNESERMNLLLFSGDLDEELIQEKIRELTSEFSGAEEVIIPPDVLVDEIRRTHQISFPHKNVFPFEVDEARISAFFNEDTGRFMELYVSELFGRAMIYTVELDIDDISIRNLPWIFFTHMMVVSPHVYGSEGDLHPQYNRPMDKRVILQVGAMGIEEVEVELYDIPELGMTSYLPRNTDVKEIEHQYFTEWRFTEPGVSKNSFYSFGKLKEGFPLKQGKEVMFEAFDIDLNYHEDLGGGTPYHYAYYSGMEGDFIDGHFQLFEVAGDWYYKHKHADREDYNGGVYTQRLGMFVEFLEKH